MGYQNRLKGAYHRVVQLSGFIMVMMLLVSNMIVPIKAASSNNLLESVSFSIGSLNYEFSPTRIYYNLTLPNNTSEVNVLVTPQDSSAKYTVAGHTNINQSSSTGKIVITVTAANGNRKWYTFAIQFGGSITTTKATTTTQVGDIGDIRFDIGVLDIPFDPAIKNYRLMVPVDTAAVKVSTDSQNVTITGNDPLDKDKPEIVVATSKDSYRFSVVWQDSSSSVPTDTTNSVDFGLEYLEVKGYTLNKPFKNSVYEYQMTVQDVSEKFEVKAIATDPQAMIEIDQNRTRMKIVVSTDDKRATYVIRLLNKNQTGKSSTMIDVFQDLLIAVVLLTLAVGLFILSRKIKQERSHAFDDYHDIDDE